MSVVVSIDLDAAMRSSIISLNNGSSDSSRSPNHNYERTARNLCGYDKSGADFRVFNPIDLNYQWIVHAGGRLPDEVRPHDAFEYIRIRVVADEGVNARLQTYDSVNEQHKVIAGSLTNDNDIPWCVWSWHRPPEHT